MIARNANEAMVAYMEESGLSLESGGMFCGGAFAGTWLQSPHIFSNLIYLKVNFINCVLSIRFLMICSKLYYFSR
jgi:hypothetical protein